MEINYIILAMRDILRTKLQLVFCTGSSNFILLPINLPLMYPAPAAEN